MYRAASRFAARPAVPATRPRAVSARRSHSSLSSMRSASRMDVAGAEQVRDMTNVIRKVTTVRHSDVVGTLALTGTSTVPGYYLVANLALAPTLTSADIVSPINSGPNQVVALNLDITGKTAFTAFQWVSQIAVGFNEHYLQKIRIDYIPSCNTQTAGQVAIGYSPDVTSASSVFSQDLVAISSLPNAKLGAVFQRVSLEVDIAKDSSLRGWRTIPRPGRLGLGSSQASAAVTTPDTLAGASAAINSATTSQLSLSSLNNVLYGRVLLALNNVCVPDGFPADSVFAFGTVKMYYEWNFRMPSLLSTTSVPSTGVLPSLSTMMQSGVTVYPSAPWGTPVNQHYVGQLGVVLSATNHSQLVFPAGDYLMMYELDGANISSFVFAPLLGSSLTIVNHQQVLTATKVMGLVRISVVMSDISAGNAGTMGTTLTATSATSSRAYFVATQLV